jgi:hypothetical protein
MSEKRQTDELTTSLTDITRTWPWRIALVLVPLACLFTLFVRGSEFLGTPYPSLLRSIEDDTFYYLQPAWNLKQKGIYSFDGLAETYGFQPLWMIVVSGLAWLSPTKEILLRSSLVMSVVLFVASGWALYRLLTKRTNSLGAALGVSVFWLLNPWLIEVFTRGKENAVHALVLVVTILLAAPLVERPEELKIKHWFLVGGALGLLVLARVNNVTFLGWLFVFWIWHHGIASLRAANFLAAISGLALSAGPWFAYAKIELGTTFPTSGSAKLKWFSGQHFVELFNLESVLRIVRSIAGVYRDVFPPVVVVLLGCAWLLTRALRDRRPSTLLSLVSFKAWTKGETALVLLFVHAVTNITATFTLLNPWFDYGIWYRVPEQVLSVYLVGRAVGALMEASARSSSQLIDLRRRAPLVLVAAAASLLWAVGYRKLAPSPPAPYRGWQDRIYAAVLEVPRVVPRGSRLGAWNAGLLGYMLDDYTVFNLDGLANSREFLEVIGPNVAGLRLTPDHRNLAQWLNRSEVKYIVDFMDVENIGKTPCFRLIGYNDCKILATVGEKMPFGDNKDIIESILVLGPISAGPEVASERDHAP